MKVTKYLFFFAFIISIFLQPLTVTKAEEVGALKVSVTTDKQEYSENEEISYKLTITNSSELEAKQVIVRSTLPTGLEVTSQDPVVNNQLTWNLEKIDPLANVEIEFKAKVKVAEAITKPVETVVESDGPTKPAGTTSPKTGDTTSIAGYILLLLFSSFVLYIASRALYKKRVTKEVTLLLVLGLLLPSFAVSSPAKAEERKETAETTHKLVINQKEYEIKTTVEALLEVPDVDPSEAEVAVTGMATDQNQESLKKKILTFTANENDTHMAETDDEGYFVIRLHQGGTYVVTGDGIEAIITVSGNNQISIENKNGQIILGRALTNGDNQSVLQPGSILINEAISQNAEVSDDLTQVIFHDEIDLVPGDVFLLPRIDGYPTGAAFKVVSVTKEGKRLIVAVSEPKLEEVFSRIKGSTEVDVTSDHFLPAPGITLVDEPEPTFNLEGQQQLVRGQSLSFNKSINLRNVFPASSPVKFSGALEVHGKVTGVIDWAFEADLVDSWDFKFEGSQIMRGTLSASAEDKIKKRLGEYRIPTSIPGVAVTMPIDAILEVEGEVWVEAQAGLRETIGVEYTDRDGIRVYPQDKVQPVLTISDVIGEGEVSLGVKLSLLAEAALVDVVGIAGEGGIASEVELALAGPSGFFKCGQTSTSFYSVFSLEAPIIGWSYPAIEKNISLGESEFGSCVRSIDANPNSMEIAPGESKILLVTAMDNKNNHTDVTVDDDISYSSSDSNIITIEKNETTKKANIIAAENAQDGDEVTVNITYKAQGKEFRDRVTVKVVDNRERGTLVGKVVDALDSAPIEGATVNIYHGDRLVSNVSSKEDGTYETSLVPGTYKIVVTYPDYITDTSNVTIQAANTTTYDSRLQMVGEEYGGVGTVAGRVTNALTGAPVAGVTLEIRKGRNTLSGEVLETITTNERGEYTLELPGGNYTMAISGDGYIATSINIVALGGIVRVNQNATISPEGVMGEGLRIVLNWGATPSDLDSHITGPADNGGRFHVYYSNKAYQDSQNQVSLDVDIVDSYGPETVTVVKRVNAGTYTYAIHNYSDRGNNNLNLSNSDATVRLYSDNVLIGTYYVPINKSGNVWRVFEIRDGVVVPINQIDFITGWNDPSYFAPQP